MLRSIHFGRRFYFGEGENSWRQEEVSRKWMISVVLLTKFSAFNN